MSAIASVLLEQGYCVSGSDLRPSPPMERLAQRGAVLHVGHAAANLGDAQAVIMSSAVPADNPELVEARRRGIPVFKRGEWLGRMLHGKRAVAVAGTHGKTTTTAMIALLARDAGLQPTFVLGGELRQLGGNAAAGAGDLFVIEADEYDRTFLGLSPHIAVVTVVEWDHPDCYPSPEAMLDAFRQFVMALPPDGCLVGCGDEPGVRELIAYQQARSSARAITYGLQAGNDWQAVEVRTNRRGGHDFGVARAGQTVEEVAPMISLRVPGLHNIKNSLAALIVADRLGIAPDRAAATLADFEGVDRRFEVKGEAGGVLVIDDYAHHPTEIRATLAAARVRYLGRPIWAVFQPHTYSRTRALLDGFAGAFGDAEHVILVDIFAAREQQDGSVSSRDILARMAHPDARYIAALPEAASYLVAHLSPGAVLMTLGAGDGYQVGEMVLDGLRNRQ